MCASHCRSVKENPKRRPAPDCLPLPRAPESASRCRRHGPVVPGGPLRPTSAGPARRRGGRDGRLRVLRIDDAFGRGNDECFGVHAESCGSAPPLYPVRSGSDGAEALGARGGSERRRLPVPSRPDVGRTGDGARSGSTFAPPLPPGRDASTTAGKLLPRSRGAWGRVPLDCGPARVEGTPGCDHGERGAGPRLRRGRILGGEGRPTASGGLAETDDVSEGGGRERGPLCRRAFPGRPDRFAMPARSRAATS